MPSIKMPKGRQAVALALPTVLVLVLALIFAVVDAVRPPPVHAAPASSHQAPLSSQRVAEITSGGVGYGDVDVAEYVAGAGQARKLTDCSRPGVTCSCQDWTFSQPTWNLTDFRYRSSLEIRSPDAEGDAVVSHGDVSFVVRNKAVPYSTTCNASSNATGDLFHGDEWYTCDQNGDGEPDKGPGLTWFRYDKTEYMIEVKQTWLCSDHGRYMHPRVSYNKPRC
ncbi:hypothetical protein RB595_008967 [Gaeumannomyces hyphopodioides]